MIPALILLALAIVCYSVTQLLMHGKFILTDPANPYGFWGEDSDKRKYKIVDGVPVAAPDTWYYNFFKIPYHEAFPLSATLLVFLTDGYHFMQFMFFLLLPVSIAIPYGDVVIFLIVYVLIHLVHSIAYKNLSK